MLSWHTVQERNLHSNGFSMEEDSAVETANKDVAAKHVECAVYGQSLQKLQE